MAEAKYYVYELRDPRSSEIFYVGKGQGKRIDAHEKEAEKGVHSPKCDLIREIWAAGLQIEKEIIERFRDEAEAYAVEKDLIASIGLDNLTNIAPGGVWIPRAIRPKKASWSLSSLLKISPALSRALREYNKFGNLFVLERDVTHLLLHTIRGLISDCGAEAVKKAMCRHGVELLIS
jgi:hypothetical protein